MDFRGFSGAPPKHPQVQRKIPKPYSRPRITLGGGSDEVKRNWRQVAVTDVAVGDTVSDVGTVAVVDETLMIPDRLWDGRSTAYTWQIRLTNVLGVVHTFSGTATVLAFTGPPAVEKV